MKTQTKCPKLVSSKDVYLDTSHVYGSELKLDPETYRFYKECIYGCGSKKFTNQYER